MTDKIRMSDIKGKHINMAVGCFSDDEIIDGDYSAQDFLDLRNAYDSLLAYVCRVAPEHDSLQDRITQLEKDKEGLVELLRDSCTAMDSNMDFLNKHKEGE